MGRGEVVWKKAVDGARRHIAPGLALNMDLSQAIAQKKQLTSALWSLYTLGQHRVVWVTKNFQVPPRRNLGRICGSKLNTEVSHVTTTCTHRWQRVQYSVDGKPCCLFIRISWLSGGQQLIDKTNGVARSIFWRSKPTTDLPKIWPCNIGNELTKVVSQST